MQCFLQAKCDSTVPAVVTLRVKKAHCIKCKHVSLGGTKYQIEKAASKKITMENTIAILNRITYDSCSQLMVCYICESYRITASASARPQAAIFEAPNSHGLCLVHYCCCSIADIEAVMEEVL